jgi:hypothetical protein
MERLICDLIERLSERREKEAVKIQTYDTKTERDQILLISGKLFELDEVIGFLENMLTYNNQIKKINQ